MVRAEKRLLLVLFMMRVGEYPESAGAACAAPVLLARRQFRAMNTDIQLIAADWQHTDLLIEAEAVFHAVEARFSRFLPSSELSQLNNSGGQEVAVSPQMFALLSQAQAFHRLTAGVFEPAVLPALEAAGYDRSFELVASGTSQGSPASPPRHRGSIADLQLDPGRLAVRMPAGLRLDLGGIGKGYAVDEAAGVVWSTGDFLIDAGGDIYGRGHGPDGLGWLVALVNPLRQGEDLALVRLHNQALATSTVARRRWLRDGRWQHHLIDPRTEEPVRNNVVSVSIIASSTTEADVFAKVALIMGLDEGRRFVEAQGAQALFVLTDETWQVTEGWPDSERGGLGP